MARHANYIKNDADALMEDLGGLLLVCDDRLLYYAPTEVKLIYLLLTGMSFCPFLGME